jgi:hypothetical protein
MLPRWVVGAMVVYYLGARSQFLPREGLPRQIRRLVDNDVTIDTYPFFINTTGHSMFAVRQISDRCEKKVSDIIYTF